MKAMTGKNLEACRLLEGAYGSDRSYGFNGVFYVPCDDVILKVMCSDGDGWDHVSVSLASRTPTWEEMSFVKDLFFDEHECVIQYHPPKSAYVNVHPNCLHLWRPQSAAVRMPDPMMV